MLRFCCFILALLFAQLTLANEQSNQKCTDDRGVNRCEDETQAKAREKYGLADIESLADEGVFVRRAMIINGYGGDVLAVSFLRQKGADPIVEIRNVKPAGAKAPQIISSAIAASDWDRMLAKGNFFERELAPKSTEAGKVPPPNICLHGWMATVEAADPIRLSANTFPAFRLKREVRRKTQSACDSGLAIEYAFQLADLAYELIPFCKSIDIDRHRNKVMALNACFLLSGDRTSAGQALSLTHGIGQALNIYPKDAAQTQMALRRLIVSPDPNNRPKPHSGTISRSRQIELAEILQQGEINYRDYKGIDADHVEIDALQVQYSDELDYNKNLKRAVTLFASREGGEFRIYDIKTSAFGETDSAMPAG